MILKTFVFDCGPLEVNHYIMADEAGGEALLVDAGVFDSSVPGFVQAGGLHLSAILVTHHHHDHIDALEQYMQAFPGAVVHTGAPLQSVPAAHLVREGDQFNVGPFVFEVFRTSGHTPEGVSFHCGSAGVCFVGDAIFAGAVGGTSNDALHEEQLQCLRRTILKLPPDTELLSGHGPATSVGIETAANPFLQPGFTRLPQG